LNIVRSKKNKARKLRHGIRKQLQYIARDQRYIANLLQDGRQLAHKYQQQLVVIQQMYAQQKHMYDHHIHRIEHPHCELTAAFSAANCAWQSQSACRIWRQTGHQRRERHGTVRTTEF